MSASYPAIGTFDRAPLDGWMDATPSASFKTSLGLIVGIIVHLVDVEFRVGGGVLLSALCASCWMTTLVVQRSSNTGFDCVSPATCACYT